MMNGIKLYLWDNYNFKLFDIRIYFTPNSYSEINIAILFKLSVKEDICYFYFDKRHWS